jgi:hypothetical protein
MTQEVALLVAPEDPLEKVLYGSEWAPNQDGKSHSRCLFVTEAKRCVQELGTVFMRCFVTYQMPLR